MYLLLYNLNECLVEGQGGEVGINGGWWKIFQNLISGFGVGGGGEGGLENSWKFNSRGVVEEILFDTLK